MTDGRSSTEIQQAAQEEIEELEEEMEELRDQFSSQNPLDLEGDELEAYEKYERLAFERDQLKKIVDGGLP